MHDSHKMHNAMQYLVLFSNWISTCMRCGWYDADVVLAMRAIVRSMQRAESAATHRRRLNAYIVCLGPIKEFCLVNVWVLYIYICCLLAQNALPILWWMSEWASKRNARWQKWAMRAPRASEVVSQTLGRKRKQRSSQRRAPILVDPAQQAWIIILIQLFNDPAGNGWVVFWQFTAATTTSSHSHNNKMMMIDDDWFLMTDNILTLGQTWIAQRPASSVVSLATCSQTALPCPKQ